MFNLLLSARLLFVGAGTMAFVGAHALDTAAIWMMETENAVGSRSRTLPMPESELLQSPSMELTTSASVSDRLTIEQSDRAGAFHDISPANAILAQHDANQLSILEASWFAPPVMTLAVMKTVNEPVDEHGNRLLHVAARSGHVAAVWQLLKMGGDPNVLNSFRKSPADVASRRNEQAQAAIRSALRSGDQVTVDVMFGRADDEASVVN